MLRIRPALIEDHEAIIGLFDELQAHERALRPSRALPEASSAAYLEHLQAELEDAGEDGLMLVAEDSAEPGRLLGLAAVYLTEDVLEAFPREAVLQDLVVTADARGRKIGRRLVREAARFAIAGGAGRMSVTALLQNDSAIAAYKAMGFEPAFLVLEAAAEPLVRGKESG